MKRVKLIGLIVALALLLLIPTLLGILLLRQPEALSQASEADVSDERIDYIQNGSPVKVGNGETFTLENDLSLAITVNPYPPDNFTPELDLYLTTAAGEPVIGAEIEVVYDMLYMSHGWTETHITNQGNGHYRCNLDLDMFGIWALDVTIRTANDEQIAVPITIYVWPAS